MPLFFAYKSIDKANKEKTRNSDINFLPVGSIIPPFAYTARDYHWMREESIGSIQAGRIGTLGLLEVNRYRLFTAKANRLLKKEPN